MPKAGSSFANALWQWGCNSTYASGPAHRKEELNPYVAECGDSFHGMPEPRGMRSSHRPILNDAEEVLFRGHVVGMLRHPVERIASGYAHQFHDCGKMSKDFVCYSVINGHGVTGPCPEKVPPELEEATVLKYAQCVAGCATHMLSGRYCNGDMLKVARGGDLNRSRWSMAQHAERALSLMRNGVYGFVGDTDQWQRSICIFAGLCIRPARTRTLSRDQSVTRAF